MRALWRLTNLFHESRHPHDVFEHLVDLVLRQLVALTLVLLLARITLETSGGTAPLQYIGVPVKYVSV